MKLYIKLASVIITLNTLASCAGRAPDPVMIAQVNDNNLSCDQITSEISQNNFEISQLSQEENLKRGQNVAADIAGAILILPLLAMDYQDAAGQEKKALEHRNQHLAGIHSNNCINIKNQSQDAMISKSQNVVNTQ